MSLRYSHAALNGHLKRIRANGGFIHAQTSSDILNYAPHLELDEADAILATANTRHYFIGPPLVVRGAEHIYCLNTEWRGVKAKVLQYVGCQRRRESYAALGTGVPESWKYFHYPYAERCADFAEIHWGSYLTWDRAQTHLKCVFLWPDKPAPHGFGLLPADIPTAMIIFDRPWIDIVTPSRMVPPFAMMESSFMSVTLETHVMCEWLGSLLPMAGFFCAYCGGGLLEHECSHCKRRCVGDMTGRLAWSLPIPGAVALHLATANVTPFPEDPVHAIKAAYAKWSMDGYISPPTASAIGNRERIVQLRSDEQ